jgi:hypothetical protein
MNKRNLALLVLIVVCALIIGLIIYYFVFYNFNKSGTKQASEPVIVLPSATLITNKVEKINQVATTTTDQAQISVEDQAIQQDATQVAKIFVARFGTYSNQAGVEQFSDLSLFVTAKMQTWVNEQIAKLIGKQADYQISHVVRTQAVSSKVSASTPTTATIIVNARRTDQTGDEAPKISNPEIKLEVIKVGKRWQVDSVVWK